jgi:hypothetical protein
MPLVSQKRNLSLLQLMFLQYFRVGYGRVSSKLSPSPGDEARGGVDE